MSAGWVKLHRCAEAHHVLQNATRRGLFDRMLMRAARKPTKVNWRNRTIALDVGQLVLSVREFADANEVGHKEARNHLARLVKEEMIKMDTFTGTGSAAVGTLITICNFAAFQGIEDDAEEREGTAPGTGGAQVGHRSGTQNKTVNTLDTTANHVESESVRAAPPPVEPPAPTNVVTMPVREESAKAHIWREMVQAVGGPDPRSIVGKMCKQYGEGEVFAVFFSYQKNNTLEAIVDAKSWIWAALAKRKSATTTPEQHARSPMASHQRVMAAFDELSMKDPDYGDDDDQPGTLLALSHAVAGHG